jgi:GNAT superfamily N-acetyltransferase
VAWLGGARSGLLHYHLDQGACEVVSLVAVTRRQGIGTQLLHAAADLAREAGCSRLWLVTTNDNLAAKALYRSQGWTLAGVHAGAVTRSRQLKPEIPLRNVEGVAIEDEFEFEHDLLGG